MAFNKQQGIATAKAEVGYLEKKTGNIKHLYEKKANAGSNNYTKYGYEMHNLYPEVMDYPASWCDCFVDWVFMKSYGVSNARKLLAGDFDDYTVNSANLYKKKNAWYTEPEVGDQIFFKNSTRICHTGLVVDVTGSYVKTIEGNTSDSAEIVPNGGAVCEKVYLKSNSRISGYGRPAYGKDIPVEAGWRRAADGKRWWYEYSDRSWAVGWKVLDSSTGPHWYYFDKDGYMLTGRQKINGELYFLEDTLGANEGACYISNESGAQRIWTLY